MALTEHRETLARAGGVLALAYALAAAMTAAPRGFDTMGALAAFSIVSASIGGAMAALRPESFPVLLVSNLLLGLATLAVVFDNGLLLTPALIAVAAAAVGTPTPSRDEAEIWDLEEYRADTIAFAAGPARVSRGRGSAPPASEPSSAPPASGRRSA